MNKESFNHLLLSEAIPLINELLNKEREHLRWLIEHDAPDIFIERSKRYCNHFELRLKEYKEYAEQLGTFFAPS